MKIGEDVKITVGIWRGIIARVSEINGSRITVIERNGREHVMGVWQLKKI